MIRRLTNLLIKAANGVTRVGMWICVSAIVVMMVLTAFDVCGRYFLNKPIRGALEFTEFLLVIAVATGFAYTQKVKGHISVELFTARLPLRFQKVFEGFGYLVCLALYVVITWQCIVGGQTQWVNEVTSGAFEIPLWPFYFFLALGTAALCLVYIADIVKLLLGEGEPA